jgi:WD repeat-containing protein 26
VQYYVNDLTEELGEQFDSVSSSFARFIEFGMYRIPKLLQIALILPTRPSGVPSIRSAQEHAAANLLNLSTVATFFSAVTATTMQFSFDQTDTPLANSVNGFWFTSLVFSIGAAVNSLLGLTWKKAV